MDVFLYRCPSLYQFSHNRRYLILFMKSPMKSKVLGAHGSHCPWPSPSSAPLCLPANSPSPPAPLPPQHPLQLLPTQVFGKPFWTSIRSFQLTSPSPYSQLPLAKQKAAELRVRPDLSGDPTLLI